MNLSFLIRCIAINTIAMHDMFQLKRTCIALYVYMSTYSCIHMYANLNFSAQRWESQRFVFPRGFCDICVHTDVYIQMHTYKDVHTNAYIRKTSSPNQVFILRFFD